MVFGTRKTRRRTSNRKWKNGIKSSSRPGGKVNRRMRRWLAYYRMKPRGLGFTTVSSWLKLVSSRSPGSLRRFTFDVDSGSNLFLAVLLSRFSSVGGVVHEIIRSPSGRGWHIRGFGPSHLGLAFVRLFCGDDPERVYLDERRPRFARQVLFTSVKS